MSKIQAMELLQAKALGCLDPEDDALLNKVMKEDENFPWQELGHYQNLVAFLPTLLDVEAPEPEVKDNIARKLYELGEKVKAEKKEEVSPNVIADAKLDEMEDDNIVIEEEPVKKAEIPAHKVNMADESSGGILFKEHGALMQPPLEDEKKEMQKPLIKHQQERPEKKTTSTQTNKELGQNNVKSYVSKLPAEPAYVEENRNKKGLILTIILFVVALLAIFFVYFKLSSEIQEIRDKIDSSGQIGEETMLENSAKNKIFKT